jgi:hypothetical protein
VVVAKLSPLPPPVVVTTVTFLAARSMLRVPFIVSENKELPASP